MWGEKKTKIVATLSDIRANEEFVRGLFEAGMDVVRINSAHVTEEGAAKIVEAVRRVNPAIPVILDTKGPEIRVTAVADEYGGAIGFQTGERVKVRGTADGEPYTDDLSVGDVLHGRKPLYGRKGLCRPLAGGETQAEKLLLPPQTIARQRNRHSQKSADCCTFRIPRS